MDQLELGEQELIRRESLKKLRELNINPYPADEYPVTHYAGDILKIEANPDAYQDVCIAGRIMGRRIMEVPHLQN